ncbi:MAG: 6-phosphogluconolactonase [Bacteroidales bacterium]|nr:6-phosphogluconolactonase [Bacteroidales bacterium]
MKNQKKYIFQNPETISIVLAEKVLNMLKDSVIRKKPFYIAISGGRTPKILFEHIASLYQDPRHWDHVHFYFVDERCVPPDHSESNYGMIYETLLRYMSLPQDNVHRMKGEEDPAVEAIRYERVILDRVPFSNDFPCFDLVILGMGADGHTASIFPHEMELFHSSELCDVGTHPETGQKRITLTGKVINNASNIFFLVTGKEKSAVLARILEKGERLKFPAGLVDPIHGKLEWYLDNDAARLLRK